MVDAPRLGGSGNEVTSQKMATSSVMMNKSADKCTAIYNHLCGTYTSRYSQSSLFQEAQLQIITEAVDPGFVTRVQQDEAGDLGVTDTSLLYEIGIFDCVDVSVEPDRELPHELSFYISPSCSDCAAQRHVHEPVLMTGVSTLALLPPKVYNLVDGQRTWWLPTTAAGLTIEQWMESEECATSSGVDKFHNITESLNNTFSTITTFYDVGYSFGTDKRLVEVLISEVKSAMVDFVMHEATFLSSDEARSAIAHRIQDIPVLFGWGENVVTPYCDTDMSLADCIRYRWFTSVQSVVTNQRVSSPDNLWSIAGIEVNAIWSPFNRAVYIPYGIAQLPFYSTEWPMWMQMATLGAVIAHEMGHAIDPGLEWSFPEWTQHAQPSDRHAVAAFLQCLDTSFEAAGASPTRANLTASENFADAVSVRVISRYLRRQSMSILRDGLTMWGQTWCSAGSPHVMPLSKDPHSSPFQRVNATFTTLATYYSAYGCGVEAGAVC